MLVKCINENIIDERKTVCLFVKPLKEMVIKANFFYNALIHDFCVLFNSILSYF